MAQVRIPQQIPGSTVGGDQLRSPECSPGSLQVFVRTLGTACRRYGVYVRGAKTP